MAQFEEKGDSVEFNIYENSECIYYFKLGNDSVV